jgi:hypothetical protein
MAFFNDSKNMPLFVTFGIGILALALFAIFLRWTGIGLSIDVTALVPRLSPLVLASGIIERAVEVLISPWRDADASKLAKEIAALKADPAAAAQNAVALKTVSDKLDDYRGVTQRYAFATSFTLSLTASVAGVRALEPFLTHPNAKAGSDQFAFFVVVDVFLTAAVIAGGADGIHSIVNAVTSFFNASADRSSRGS